MLSTQDPVPGLGTACFYLTVDPFTLEASKMLDVIENHWEKIPQIEYSLGNLNTAAVGELVMHLVAGRLYRREITQEWVFMEKDVVIYGHNALNFALKLARRWVRAASRVETTSSNQLSLKARYHKAAEVLESPKKSKDVREYVANEIDQRVIRATSMRFTDSIPILLEPESECGCLEVGVLDLKKGITRKMPPSDEFPTLSKLKLRESWAMVSREVVEKSKFFAHIMNLVGEKDHLAWFMLEVLAYYCTRGNPKEVFVVITGDGGNGKSILIYVLKEILGSLAVKGNNDTYSKYGKNRFSKSEFVHSYLAYFSELPMNYSLDVEAVKADTEQTLNYEEKYKGGREKETWHKPMFVSNHKVIIEDRTRAAFGRLIRIPTVGKNWRDDPNRVDLYNKVLWEEEQNVILSALVYGYQAFARRGKFDIPEEFTKDLREDTMRMNEVVEDYVLERLEEVEGSSLRAGEIQQDFEMYCRKTGAKFDKRDLTNLGKCLKDRYDCRRDREGRRYEGVAFYGGRGLNIGDLMTENLDMAIDTLNRKGIGL